MIRTQSADIYTRSLECMPGGVSSPVRALKGMGITPLVVKGGKEDRLFDVDGHAYIDYCIGWGSLILGHAHSNVVAAAKTQMNEGSSFGTATPYELALAKRIQSHLPSMEKIRFVSSGTEATMSAIRLARGFTGRSICIKFVGHYHGHSDSLLVEAGSGVADLPQATSLGVPEDFLKYTHCLPFNEIDACRSHLRRFSKDIAAIILEPIAGNMGVVPADPDFIQMLREEATAAGIILIFDEVITGFRVGLQGAQGLYGIEPDLTCLGKIIGGGFPVAAFGGRRDLMDLLAPLGAVYQAGTLSGNPVAMCAGLAVLEAIAQAGFYEELERKTRLLVDPIAQFIDQKGMPITINRVGSMFTLFLGSREQFRSFFLYLFERGIYIPPSPYETWFISSAHTDEHIMETRHAILSFFS